ncbi:hypothetical protein [Formosa algae]|uniref:Transposase-like protein n=1 Tax=Formosa algae TaxID=225843 RepID=A0A9X0YK57_9FLAO|nr:hypothetical protein [Formosa algae]MBP1840292.1 transposase-like protein [Formosa algae]MDQ0334156.1 transposase-like protein [Formosa algae]
MENPTQKKGSLPKLYCNIFGHSYEVTKQVTHHVKEYKCKHCNRELTTYSNGNLVELTPKFKEINTILNRIHSSKQARLKNRTYSEPSFH